MYFCDPVPVAELSHGSFCSPVTSELLAGAFLFQSLVLQNSCRNLLDSKIPIPLWVAGIEVPGPELGGGNRFCDSISPCICLFWIHLSLYSAYEGSVG